MVFEHEWFLNTNIFLNTNNSNFTNLNCYAIFSIKKNRVIQVQKIRVQKI